MPHGNAGRANGVAGPIRESRRLRIVISHRRNAIKRHEDEAARLRDEVEHLESQLALVLKAEAAAVGGA